MNGPKFYTYLWLRANETPYYVGKGTRKRAFAHHARRQSTLNRPRNKSDIVLFPMENEALAFESEKALIELFGRKDSGTGILHNLTDGGDQPPGMKGRKHTAETIAKMSRPCPAKGPHGRHHSAEHRRKIGQAQIGKIIPQEARLKMRAAKLGRQLSAEHRQNMSNAQFKRQRNICEKQSSL